MKDKVKKLLQHVANLYCYNRSNYLYDDNHVHLYYKGDLTKVFRFCNNGDGNMN